MVQCSSPYFLPYAIILKLQVVILYVVINAGNVVRKGAVGVVHKSTIVFRARCYACRKSGRFAGHEVPSSWENVCNCGKWGDWDSCWGWRKETEVSIREKNMSVKFNAKTIISVHGVLWSIWERECLNCQDGIWVELLVLSGHVNAQSTGFDEKQFGNLCRQGLYL